MNSKIKIKVTENKAPTDASLALLREMEDKALKSILGNITFKDNNFFGRIEVMRDYLTPGDKKCYLQFSLNGNKHLLSFTLLEEHTHSIEESINSIVKMLSDYLARTVFANMGETLLNTERELLKR